MRGLEACRCRLADFRVRALVSGAALVHLCVCLHRLRSVLCVCVCGLQEFRCRFAGLRVRVFAVAVVALGRLSAGLLSL